MSHHPHLIWVTQISVQSSKHLTIAFFAVLLPSQILVAPQLFRSLMPKTYLQILESALNRCQPSQELNLSSAEARVRRAWFQTYTVQLIL